MIIRPLATSELSQAAEVIRRSFTGVAAEFGITEQNCPSHTSFITVEKLRGHVRREWLMFGLYDGVRLAGYVSLSDEGGGVFELHNLAVLPEFRHQGFGKQLLDFCKEKVAALGGHTITIGIIEENTVLKNWYAGNGFVHTGTKNFDHLPFTAGYMAWAGQMSIGKCKKI